MGQTDRRTALFSSHMHVGGTPAGLQRVIWGRGKSGSCWQIHGVVMTSSVGRPPDRDGDTGRAACGLGPGGGLGSTPTALLRPCWGSRKRGRGSLSSLLPASLVGSCLLGPERVGTLGEQHSLTPGCRGPPAPMGSLHCPALSATGTGVRGDGEQRGLESAQPVCGFGGQRGSGPGGDASLSTAALAASPGWAAAVWLHLDPRGPGARLAEAEARQTTERNSPRGDRRGHGVKGRRVGETLTVREGQTDRWTRAPLCFLPASFPTTD